MAGLYFGNIQQGGAAPFSPSDIAGMLGWYGDLVNSGTQRSTLGDGDTITQWDDQSGNATHLAAVSTPNWDASNEWIHIVPSEALVNLTAPMLSGSTAHTVFSAIHTQSDITGENFYGFGDYNNSDEFRMRSEAAITQIYNGPTPNTNRYFSPAVSTNTKYITTAFQSGNTIQTVGLRKNGAWQTVNATNGTTMSIGQGITVGCAIYLAAANFFGKIDFMEHIVYDSALSQANIDLVEGWLNTKYSIY